MQNYFLILLGAETLLLLVFVYLLIHKSRQLTRLFDEFSRLRKEESKLQVEQKRQDDFMPMLVHELRSPLSIIKGSSDLILREANNLSREDIEKLLAQIRTSSTGLLKIVNDILDASKMESGIFKIEKVEGNMNALLEEEREYYNAKAKEKGINFALDLDSNLPRFKFDPDRIRQVMNNFLSNALKFTPEGGSVYIKSYKGSEGAVISVCDSGPGIPEEVKPKLFHKFVQMQNGTGKEKGTGLGLVIAKGIIEAHGGRVWIEDNNPRGAKFVFQLPL